MGKRNGAAKVRFLTAKGFSRKEAELELEADRLLAESNSLGVKKGVFTEYQLKNRGIQVESLEDHLCDDIQSFQPIDDICAVEWRELLAGAEHLGITMQDKIYLELAYQGLTLREIAQVSKGTDWEGCPKTIQNHLRRTGTRIANAYPYFGLWEIIARSCGVSKGEARIICESK